MDNDGGLYQWISSLMMEDLTDGGSLNDGVFSNSNSKGIPSSHPSPNPYPNSNSNSNSNSNPNPYPNPYPNPNPKP